MLENKAQDVSPNKDYIKDHIKHATYLVQVAELDIARYLQCPEDFEIIEYMETVQMALTEALELLGSNPIPLNEE
jgi:hypothetical protein